MTDLAATPHPARLYRLGTLGSLALADPSGDTVLGTHGHHKRRLALLAVLAAAGDRGRSRDQLLLLFWPEATQSRARHSLDQLLYALRGSISESVFASVNPVRLSPDVVSTDVGAFNDAIARGDLEDAIDEYRGPFLDGFYLDDAPEFERWVEIERARLAASFASALEGLARAAESEHNFTGAVRWWRALADTDRLSNQHASGVIRALMGAGDHSSALQYAEQHEALVEKELGTSAGPAIAELVAEVRARANAERVLVVSDATPASGTMQSTPARARAAPNAPPLAPQSPRRRASMFGVAGIAFVLIASAVALFANRGTGKASPAPSTTNVAAYELVMRANNPDVIRDDSTVRVALGYLEQAIKLDSNYAAAWATLARLQIRSLNASDMPRATRIAVAEAAAKKAIALDSTLAAGYAALQGVRRQQLRYVSAETELKRAIALEPKNARYREMMVQLYLRMDRNAEALAEGKRAIDMEPASPTANAEYAAGLIANDRCEEALARLAKVQSLQVPLLRVQSMLVRCYTRQRKWPDAIAAAERNVQRGGVSAQVMLAYTYGKAGRSADARKMLAPLLGRSGVPVVDPIHIALVYAGLGENDQAFSWLDKAIAEESLGGGWGQLEFLFEALQTDPRVGQYKRRIALIQNRERNASCSWNADSLGRVVHVNASGLSVNTGWAFGPVPVWLRCSSRLVAAVRRSPHSLFNRLRTLNTSNSASSVRFPTGIVCLTDAMVELDQGS